MIDKDVFNKNAIIFESKCKTQAEVFELFTDYFIKNGYTENKEEMIQAFWEREKEGSTAFTDGIGIPHAKSKAVIKPGICVVKLQEGIDWDSMDDLKTFFFIGLAIPENNAQTIHLKMLSSIARKLVDKEFKKKLLSADSLNEVFELISEIEIK